LIFEVEFLIEFLKIFSVDSETLAANLEKARQTFV
jgi:hypothetical protein